MRLRVRTSGTSGISRCLRGCVSVYERVCVCVGFFVCLCVCVCVAGGLLHAGLEGVGVIISLRINKGALAQGHCYDHVRLMAVYQAKCM